MSNPKSLAQANLRERGAPEFVRANEKANPSQRLAIAGLAEGNDAWAPVFRAARAGVFETKKARALRTNARFPGGLMLRSNAQQGTSKASSNKNYGADSLRPPKRSSTPFRGARTGS
jgi:hypothetical protein